MKSNRLYFIDAVRAYAILMMLQGHFIDALLDKAYRDKSHIMFSIWEYFRGNTAPIFFTVSGLIFTYLLIKAKNNGTDHKRIKKGLWRGLLLIGIGYLLRIPLLEWLTGQFNNTYFLVIDVLQCIGLSLIGIIIIYKLVLKKTAVFSVVMLLLGLLIFTTEPLYRYYDGGNLPLIIANYVSTKNGSVFTILPWFGFMAFGAFIATLFQKYLLHKTFRAYTLFGFFTIGMLLIFTSSFILEQLYYITNIDLFLAASNYNYLYLRLGNVLVVFGLFYACENYIKQQSLFLKIGQETLSLYVIHFIILYGSFTGLGLYQFFKKSLHPYEAILGAIAFLVGVCIIALNYVKIKTLLTKKLSQLYSTKKQ